MVSSGSGTTAAIPMSPSGMYPQPEHTDDPRESPTPPETVRDAYRLQQIPWDETSGNNLHLLSSLSRCREHLSRHQRHPQHWPQAKQNPWLTTLNLLSLQTRNWEFLPSCRP